MGDQSDKRDPQRAYDEALKRIERCRAKKNTELDLSSLGLETLPMEIGRLTALTTLFLSGNYLVTLPADIGELTSLKELYLSDNELTTLPSEIGGVAALKVLSLSHNRLAALPPELGRLTALSELRLDHNQLAALPPELGRLTALTTLSVHDNWLNTLPAEFTSLKRLQSLSLFPNPLPSELLAALKTGGVNALFELLDSARTAGPDSKVAAPRRFDEVKLLLLGPGNVGKTWLLQALEGKVPEETGSTKGIQILRWPLDVPHPTERGRTIHLNCWDFGGQDFYQVTHQIFFSQRAVYLMVWNPRSGLDPRLVERLERIQLSAGRSAKVLIVATHADSNVPAMAMGQEAIRERFGELVWGFYEVDSQKGPQGTGVERLKEEIAKAAAQLDGIDQTYPRHWHDARSAIQKTGKPTIMMNEFVDLCQAGGLAPELAPTLASVMEVQGHAVFFADAAQATEAKLDGKNLVVLDPQWLAKAICHVIEDGKTVAGNGHLQHGRLATIWKKDPKRECIGYAKELHGYLLWLMWRFFIAYRLDKDWSLVPELIATNRPDNLRWTPAVKADGRQAELVFKFDHEPPIGIVPALTAAVHPYRFGGTKDDFNKNWKDGFFLATELRGQAFVELQDRVLWMAVRDGYPAHLMTDIVDTLREIAKQRWPKLVLEELVPCMGCPDGKACKGTHRRAFLESMRQEQQAVQCQVCGSMKLDPAEMLDGFDKRERDVLAKLEVIAAGQRELVGSAHAIFTSIDPENWLRRRGPSMFTVLPAPTAWYKKVTHESVGITCWCEHPDGPHPAAPIGSEEPPDYLLTMPKAWLVKVEPYIAWAAKLFKAFGGLGIAHLTGDLEKTVQEQIKAMNEAAKSLLSGEFEPGKRETMGLRHRESVEVMALQSLLEFLEEKIPADQRWGDLRPVQTNSGKLLWLCAKHAQIQQPPPETLG